MANEFVAKNGLISQNNSIVSGSLTVTQGITGSLFGTASYATQALSASYVPSTAIFPYAGAAVITGSLLVLGTGSVAFTSLMTSSVTSQSFFLISGTVRNSGSLSSSVYGVNISPTLEYITSSQTATALRVAPTFLSGSTAVSNSILNIIADIGTTGVGSQFVVNDLTSGSIYQINTVSGLPLVEVTSDSIFNIYNYPTKIFSTSGSAVTITGSLKVEGTLDALVTYATSASYLSGLVENAITALTASFVTGSNVRGPFGSNSILTSSYATTASYVAQAVSASFATTASFVTLAQTASYVLNAQTASFVTLAQTASYVATAQTASFVTLAQTASYVLNAVSSSYALTASYATNAGGGGSSFPFSGSAVITGSLLVSGSGVIISGSLTVTQGITGSLFGTASWAENALTASYLSGYVSPFPYTGSAIITGSLVITGSLTATANSTINGLSVGKGNNDIATNTAFGVSALAVNIAGATAVSNTAIGRLTLAANTNGSNSTAVGNQALQLNSVGIWNTAVGSTALGSNTSGSYNTAVGVGASLLLSTGSFNTAIGSYAGRRSNGTFNTIMGYNTFQATSTGGSNTIIGGQAGYSATGNDNTLIGTQAGYNLTSGNNNVILGNNTGFGLTTGIANTILGGYVQGLATGLSNTVILADGTGSIRLYSPSTGNVLIGTTTDGGYKFDVSGSGVSGSVRFQNGLTVTGSLLTSGSSITFTPSVIATTVSQSYFLITGSIQQVQTASAQIYGINIAPIMIFTTGSQTNTVLRVAPTFSGSAALTSSQQNIVADFGAVGVGTQFSVNDITSGSIYMVNDVSGLPIIEALSDWTVNMYNFPTKVFQKTGSAIIISGSLNVNGSINVGGRQAVNGPTIRVNANTVTTQMTSSVVAIIKFDTVLWDSGSLSGSNFNMTNANASINGYTVGPYSFSPSVAGYYQVAGHFSFGSMGASTGTIITTIYKNGSEYCRGTRTPCNVSGGSGDVNTIIYFNGAGDYINIQAIQNSGNTETTEASSAFGSWFTATMLRGA